MVQEAYITSQYAGSCYPELHHGVGLSIQHYEFESHLAHDYSSDVRSHTASPFMQPGMGSSSPPTPMSHHSDTRRTRSGRSIVRNDSPHSSVNRSSSSRPNRKKKAPGTEKHRTPKLTAPLSVLTKDMIDVPVRDMEAWVKRPTEERMKEAEKRNGYITRPMNSFMLYRSAYAERTKMWCLHNNHQVVSSVSGESWPLEPPEVREFYNELAKMERINHQNAHPNYKFSPSKPGAVSGGSKKRSRADDEDSEPSDLDDPDWVAASGARSRPAKRYGREASYPVRATRGNTQDPFHDLYSRPTSGWDQLVQQQPVVALPYQQIPYPQQFYPSPTMQQQHHIPMVLPSQHQQSHIGNVLDDTAFPANQSLIGFPGGNHSELLGLHDPATALCFEHQVDPMLLNFDDCQGTLEGSGIALSQYPSSFEPGFVQHTVEGAGSPLITDYRPKEWVPVSTSPVFGNTTSEFDKLWHEHELERKASLRSLHGGSGQPSAAEQSRPIGMPSEDTKSPETV